VARPRHVVAAGVGAQAVDQFVQLAVGQPVEAARAMVGGGVLFDPAGEADALRFEQAGALQGGRDPASQRNERIEELLR